MTTTYLYLNQLICVNQEKYSDLPAPPVDRPPRRRANAPPAIKLNRSVQDETTEYYGASHHMPARQFVVDLFEQVRVSRYLLLFTTMYALLNDALAFSTLNFKNAKAL